MITKTHVKITNISDSRKVVEDALLPNGILEVESMQVTFLPVQVFNNVWRRYDDWMRDLSEPGNAQYLDMIVEQIDEPLVCPHCGKCYDEEVQSILDNEPESFATADIPIKVIEPAKTTKTRRKKRTARKVTV